MPLMTPIFLQDLRAFRGGSDFSVSVGGELFRLHKFPLYAKCEYFKVKYRPLSEKVC